MTASRCANTGCLWRAPRTWRLPWIVLAVSLLSAAARADGPAGEAVFPPPPGERYVVPPHETMPAVKQLASDVAVALTTYNADEAAADIAPRLPGRPAATPAAQAAQSLHHAGSWSRGRIIYPQLGGLLPDRASVMVVVEQIIGSPSQIRTETRSLDIRIRLADGQWRFDHLASDGGEPVPRPPDLSREAAAVLDHPGIQLPDSARWDIHAGRISSRLLGVMARAADHVPFAVAVLKTGHPWEIFGTVRQSDHTRGYAVDIYRVGERNVIDDREAGSPTHRFLTWLYAQEDVARIGGPWALDGFGGRSFTDQLHQDHLHLAVPWD